MVERQPSKLNVASSNLVSRSFNFLYLYHNQINIARVAQLVERQPSKLNVASSNLVSRSFNFLYLYHNQINIARVAQLVERQPSKLNVASSNLVSRSFNFFYTYSKNYNRRCSSGVERFLGKEEVSSSILDIGSSFKLLLHSYQRCLF